ncbi:hypothetical protein [Paenibacillus roseipurpureus]|uniref:Uncharacterized protein n=1 Tax=Paenibacillus roseopurpureus TaxID=2918901 RepID=A0AA96RHS8_9BACL|nr:hypothetical protein [Paenibacillus sp. MBLB1832]WNR42050.1 hypothetical protein MJB10_12975 [Paenibacillus sp. MBLB1832]
MLAEISKNELTAFMLPRYSGVTKIGIGIKDTSGRKSANMISIPIYDHVSREQVEEQLFNIRMTYFPGVYPLDLTHIVSLMQPTGAYNFNKQEVQLLLSLIAPNIEPK